MASIWEGNDTGTDTGVQRAALKRITGAAAVGAMLDAEDESKWPFYSHMTFTSAEGNAKKRALKPKMGHVMPTAEDVGSIKGKRDQ